MTFIGMTYQRIIEQILDDAENNLTNNEFDNLVKDLKNMLEDDYTNE